MLFVPRHEYLVGVDSDGCVFDSMEVKQVTHFHPLIIQHWGLEAIEPQLRAIAEYVNLRSPWRGSNRFVALQKTFELLLEVPSVRETEVELPDPRPLLELIETGDSLSNDSLSVAAASNSELKRVLAWSVAVNEEIATNMMPIPPFQGAAEALKRMHERADVVVVSLTPVDALDKEWTIHDLRRHVDGIAGQEWGTKQEQLRLALNQWTYDLDKVLLIGDAPGDLKAAREVGISFLPTVPGCEEECWHRLLEEDLDRFFNGEYRGAVERNRVAEFEARLSEAPPLDI